MVLKRLKEVTSTDDRGVSPVIGVILMVAITVILAAVIASFVLGLGDTDDPAPSIVFESDFNSDGDEKTITITSGDSDADEELLTLEGENTDEDELFDSLGAGESITLEDGENGDTIDINGDDEVQLIWDDDDILDTFDVSDL